MRHAERFAKGAADLCPGSRPHLGTDAAAQSRPHASPAHGCLHHGPGPPQLTERSKDEQRLLSLRSRVAAADTWLPPNWPPPASQGLGLVRQRQEPRESPNPWVKDRHAPSPRTEDAGCRPLSAEGASAVPPWALAWPVTPLPELPRPGAGAAPLGRDWRGRDSPGQQGSPA